MPASIASPELGDVTLEDCLGGRSDTCNWDVLVLVLVLALVLVLVLVLALALALVLVLVLVLLPLLMQIG